MANKKAEKATLAVIKSTEDASVPQILEALNKEIASLKHVTESAYKTTGNLEGFGDIKTEKTVANLIKGFSMVLAKKAAYDNAQQYLGFQNAPVFNIGGYGIEAWADDIKLRKAVLEHGEKLKKLNEYKEKWSKFMTEQDQKEILKKEMMATLGLTE